MAPERRRLRLGLAAAILQLARPGPSSYDYRDIVPKYCHLAKDWGPLPERPPHASQLLQAQVFIRHGARVQCSSEYCWQGDKQGSFTCGLSYLDSSVNESGVPMTPFFRKVYMPGRNSIPGNCMLGQLVESGFEMERRNGHRLRDAYIAREALLPAAVGDLSPGALRFRSTDVPRTAQSGMALLSGMYGEPSGSRHYPEMTLRTMDFAEENMLVNKQLCPGAAVQGAAEFFNRLPAEQAAEMKALCAQLNPAKRSNSECFWWLQHLVDCLMSRACPTVPFSPHNQTVPAAFLANDAALFRRVWKVVDEVQWAYFQAAAVNGAFGAFAAEILALAEGAASLAAGTPRLMLWSGHDTGPMLPLWAAFGLRTEPPFWPPFASMLVLEVWQTAAGPVTRWISHGAVVRTATFAEFKREATAVVDTGRFCRAGPPSMSVPVKKYDKTIVEGLLPPVARTRPAAMAAASVCTGVAALVLYQLRKEG